MDDRHAWHAVQDPLIRRSLVEWAKKRQRAERIRSIVGLVVIVLATIALAFLVLIPIARATRGI